MNDVIQGLQGVTAGAIISIIVAIVTVISVVYKYLEKYRKLKNSLDLQVETIANNSKRLDEIEEKVMTINAEFVAIKDEEDNDFQQLNAKIDELSDSVQRLIQYGKDRDKADLKDRIRDLYDRYHKRGTITKIEKESLLDLIGTYDRCNGNSFVHSLVIPEIPTWKEID